MGWEGSALGQARRDGRSGSRYFAYRAAWLYLCAWVVTVSLDSVPGPLRFVSIGVAGASAVFILRVLLTPRPT